MKRRGYIYKKNKKNPTWGEIRATNAELIVKNVCVSVWGGYRPSISRHFRAPNILTLTFKFMWSCGLGGHGSLPFESSAVQVFSYISGSLLNSLKWVNSDSEDVNKLHRCYIWDLFFLFFLQYLSICLGADTAYRLVSVLEAPVTSLPQPLLSLNPPQQLLSIQIKGWRKSARRHFALEYEIYSPLGVEPRVPALIPPQPNNNNSQSAQPWQKESHFTAGL